MLGEVIVRLSILLILITAGYGCYQMNKLKSLKEKTAYEWCMKEYMKDASHCSIWSTFSDLEKLKQ